jgi:ubiquinone/menaquinone biosynthesis C-methylase UbiE
MSPALETGIPLTEDYQSLLTSDLFSEMEAYSGAFILRNRDALNKYSDKWVKDPLHQWSRQWEYPFVYNEIKKITSNKSNLKILDAGSGLTFFPYYLGASRNSNIHCCDYDKNLENAYNISNTLQKNQVTFSSADLKKLPYEDQFFDVVYSVSVLEHTDEYEKIISELDRVLAPDGVLILTIDISLDGTRDISIERAKVLLGLLEKYFSSATNFSKTLDDEVKKANIFTTYTAKDIDSNLLPWKFPNFVYQLKNLLSSRRIIPWPPKLTFLCGSFSKKTLD